MKGFPNLRKVSVLYVLHYYIYSSYKWEFLPTLQIHITITNMFQTTHGGIMILSLKLYRRIYLLKKSLRICE